MAVKPSSKTVAANRAVKPKTVPKKPVSSALPSEKNDFQKIIDLHTKHLQKLDGMFSTLDAELREIKKLIGEQHDVKNEKKSNTAMTSATTARGKALVKAVPKSAVVTSAKSARDESSKFILGDLIVIPNDVANRINSLTYKKRVTQTQLGKDVEMSQKEIHEIVTRKMKELSKEKIDRIYVALQRYEK